jgi:thiosulfate/3-mercaptopyruvate sulfurtransferase
MSFAKSAHRRFARPWRLWSVAGVWLLAAPVVLAQAFNYISPADLKKRLESGDKLLLLDIQVEPEYAKHHLPGALPTYAYPAKTDEERAKLKPALSKILASKEEVVIVCPGGGSGAKNAFDFLRSQGVPESRMRILEKGQNGWPYQELVKQGP